MTETLTPCRYKSRIITISPSRTDGAPPKRKGATSPILRPTAPGPAVRQLRPSGGHLGNFQSALLGSIQPALTPGAAPTLADHYLPAGLRHDRVVAPLVLEGAIDGASFIAWVEQFLAPALKPGDIALADNLSNHKVAGVREAIAARGARV